MNLNLKMTVERSRSRSSYFLSLVFITNNYCLSYKHNIKNLWSAILNTSNCKNSYITSILEKNKSFHNTSKTLLTFFKSFANFGKAIKKEIPQGNHSLFLLQG